MCAVHPMVCSRGLLGRLCMRSALRRAAVGFTVVRPYVIPVLSIYVHVRWAILSENVRFFCALLTCMCTLSPTVCSLGLYGYTIEGYSKLMHFGLSPTAVQPYVTRVLRTYVRMRFPPRCAAVNVIVFGRALRLLSPTMYRRGLYGCAELVCTCAISCTVLMCTCAVIPTVCSRRCYSCTVLVYTRMVSLTIQP